MQILERHSASSGAWRVLKRQSESLYKASNTDGAFNLTAQPSPTAGGRRCFFLHLLFFFLLKLAMYGQLAHVGCMYPD